VLPFSTVFLDAQVLPFSTVFLDAQVLPFSIMIYISDLAGTSKVEMQALFDRILYLPELDLSLQVPLPLFHTPHLDRAIRALNDEEDEVFDQKLVHVVPLVATAEHRWRSPGQWSRCETKAYSKKACRTGGSRTRPTDLDPLHLLGR
jgi:hypothetical protein